MAVYRPLRDIDVLQTVLTAGKRVNAVSGTAGWRGGPNGTGSVSVYGDFRGPGSSAVTVQPRVFPGVNDIGYAPISGTYPLTASIRYVDVLLSDRTESKETWGNRSWRSVDRLYEYYYRYNTAYHTGTYDFKCVFFRKGGTSLVSNEDRNGGYAPFITSSMTLEAWIKPFSTSSLNTDGMTIANRRQVYWVGLTGTDGRLAMSSSFGLFTSSLTVPMAEWSHVGVSITTGTGTFYVGLRHAGTFNFTSPIITGNASFSIGSRPTSVTMPASGSSGSAFHGLIHEVREWRTGRTWEQISGSHNMRLNGDETNLLNYFSPREGSASGSALLTVGSSSDNGASVSTSYPFQLYTFTDTPTWQPCDNALFYPDKTLHRRSVSKTRFRVVNIPRLMYGRQIATGSVELTCRSFSGTGREMIRVLRDDGRGSLYVHSYVSSSMDDNPTRTVPWNRVGNVFYTEGLIVITDDSVLDLATSAHFSSEPSDLLSVSFRGTNMVPTKMISCRIGPAEANASNNPTFAVYSSGSDRYELVDDTRTTWITAVGLYDDKNRLVGVAKLAAPLRKRERDRFNIRLKLDL